MNAVDELYIKAAEFHNITVQELIKRTVKGEQLIHQYHTRYGYISF